HLSEVARCCHNAESEMPTPDAVDHDARGQRVVWRSDGFGQRTPASAAYVVGPVGWMRFEQGRAATQNGEETRLDGRPFFVGLDVLSRSREVQRRNLKLLPRRGNETALEIVRGPTGSGNLRISEPVGREAVVAVADAIRDRQRRREFILKLL